MAGLAKTNAFQFTMASVLIGPMASQLTLNTAAHSIGLVKGLKINSTTGFVDLGQGVQNQIIESMVNKFDVTCSCEVYEYTSRNLAYGLGLDGTAPTSYVPVVTDYPLAAAVAAAATSATVASDVHAQFLAGQFGYLQESSDDVCHVFKTNAASVYSSPNTTISFTGYPVPTGMAFDTANGVIGAFNKIDTNPVLANQYFAMRVVGVTSDASQRPVIVHFPKVKITKGFAMAFENSNFANLPFEFQPMVPVPNDPGYNADFSQMMSVLTPN
jgi:hypothetical protein